MEVLEAYAERHFSELEEKIGIDFTDKNHIVQALVHRSYLNENRDFGLAHNERLEFLGELTNWRAALVNSKMCASVAREIDLEPFLFLSRGEMQDVNTKARDYILANALEAVIGAIYMDKGWDMTKQFVTRWVITKLPEVLELGLWMDPKSRFQEAAQEIIGVTPTYKVIKEEGPDHAKEFTVGVYLGKEYVAEGIGSSKQEGQIDAAEKALRVKAWKGPKVEILERKPGDQLG